MFLPLALGIAPYKYGEMPFVPFYSCVVLHWGVSSHHLLSPKLPDFTITADLLLPTYQP